MATDFKDYRSYHLNRIKDDKAAACFLAAALEDAISENDIPHFLRALKDVQDAKGIDVKEAASILATHCGADAPNVMENSNILFIRMVELLNKIETDHLELA